MSKTPLRPPSPVKPNNNQSKHTQSKSLRPKTSIPENDKKLFAECGVVIKSFVRYGKYGVVYSGHFNQHFQPNKFSAKISVDSCVGKGVAKANSKFALKYVSVEERQDMSAAEVLASVRRERDILLECCFETIVEAYYVLSFGTDRRFYLLLELADTDVSAYLRAQGRKKLLIAEALAKQWIRSLLLAASYLHERGISHGNINCSNALLFLGGQQSASRPRLKLADFFNAQKIEPSILKDNSGSQEAIVAENRMDGDIYDLHLVIDRILDNIEFESTTNPLVVYAVIRQMVTNQNDSRTLLNSLLTQTDWVLR